MILDFLTLLYILLIGGGIVIILVIIRFLRNEVWVAKVDDGQAHIYAFLKKDDESGAAQIFMAGDTTEPPVGHVQFKENVGQILIKREGGSTSGKNQYKKVGFVDAEGYLYRYGKMDEAPERIGYLAAPSNPAAPTLHGERTWRDFWWSCRLDAYLGNPEDYVAPPKKEKKNKKGGKEEKKQDEVQEKQLADTPPTRPESGEANTENQQEAPVHFASERIPKEDQPHLNGSLIREIEAALEQAKSELEKEKEQAALAAEAATASAAEADSAAESSDVTQVVSEPASLAEAGTAVTQNVSEPAPESETNSASEAESGAAAASEADAETESTAETTLATVPDAQTEPSGTEEDTTEEPVEEEEPLTPEEEAHLNRILEHHQDVIREIIDQFVLVKGGSFVMGTDGPKKNVSEENTGYGVSENEGPAHPVTVSDFFIGRYPITQRQWTAIMGYNPSENQENSLYPVAPVNWDECSLFAKRLKRLTGLAISLPTEAQWEYAARGGRNQDGFIYSGSDLFSEVGCDSPYYPVGSKKPNSLGIYDMSGLVREWCQDWYEIHYTVTDNMVDPKGPDAPPDPEDPTRVVRSPRGNDTVTNRKGELPTDLPFKSYGLRLVCNSDPRPDSSRASEEEAGVLYRKEEGLVDKKRVPPVLIGRGIKTGWFSGDTPGCPLTLESRAAAFSVLSAREGESYTEHIADGCFSWKDTALFSSVLFCLIFLVVYFINVGILEYPLLGNDFKAILVFSAFYFVIWAVVRMYKIYTIEAGRSVQSFFTLFNKSLGVKKLDLLILILSVIAIPLCFFKFDADFIPLFIALILGTGINRMIRKNGRKWEVRNPLVVVPAEEDENQYDRKTRLLNKPEGDVAVEYQWKLQSFTEGKTLDCFLSFWYDRELIEMERLLNPFYLENPQLRNKPSVFKSYVGKMIDAFKTRPDLEYHLRYVIQEMGRMADKNDLSEMDRLQVVLDFVQQSIAYVKDEESKTISKPYLYVRFPDEVLFDMEGDCNCKAFLAGSMYYLMGYDVLYASSTKLGHTLIGLKLDPDLLAQYGIVMDNDNTLEYNNSRYIVCETTHEGFKIGKVAEGDSASKFDVVVEYIHEYEEE